MVLSNGDEHSLDSDQARPGLATKRRVGLVVKKIGASKRRQYRKKALKWKGASGFAQTPSMASPGLDQALTPSNFIELFLSHKGLVLAPPTHPVISILQHLSKKPWIHFDLNSSNTVDDLQTEWQQLSDNCAGEYLQFYVDLKECAGQQGNGIKTGFFTLGKYIQKEFTCYLCTNKIGVTEAFTLTTSGEMLPASIETSLKILDDGKEENIFLYFDDDETHRSRLITKYELLYPDSSLLGEKLIDQIDQFHLISKASKKTWTGDISTVVSSTEYLDEVNSIIRKIERGQTFTEILTHVLPTDLMESAIVSKLLKIEHRLSSEEKLDLRIKLIELTATELFYPMRKMVLFEKEKHEASADESAEMQCHLQKDGEYLAREIATTEVKLKEAESNISKATEDIENLKRSTNEIDTEQDEQLKENLLAKLQQMKEQMAFNKFVLDLPSHLRPEKTVQCLTQISKLDEHTTVSVLMERIFSIFGIANETKNCPYLGARVIRNWSSDKEELFRVLRQMAQLSHIDIDKEGDLFVQGGNVILSSILPKIVTSLQSHQDIQQVKICCRGNLVLNVSLNSKHLSGRNVIIVAANIVSSEAKVTIDVSGEDGKNHTDSKAKNGVNFGGDGEDGLPGEHGQHGGSIHIEAVRSILNMENITLKCNGGNGANGQHGGDGHCGRDGNNGEIGHLESPTWFCKYYAISPGKAGERGQPGGLGGLGGTEGDGGKGGISKIISSDNAEPIEQKHCDGRKGVKGRCGDKGSNGKNGMVGKDHGRFARSMLSGWEYKIGYNLKAKEIPGWLWKIAGYYIVEGEEPQIQSVQSKTRQHSKQKQATKQQQQQQIFNNTIQSMKQIIAEKKIAGNSSKQSENETIIINQQLDQVQQSIDSKHAVASDQQQVMIEKTAALKQLQVAKSSLSIHLGGLESRHAFVEQAIQSTKREAEIAEIRAREIEQVALLLREEHEQALERGKVTQRQMQQEIQNERKHETMISKEGTTPQESGEQIESTSTGFSSGLTSSFATTYAKSKEFKEFNELCTKNKVPFGVQQTLESCWQRIENTDRISKKLISNLCVNHEWKYIKNDLASDLSVARKFSKFYSPSKADMPTTLAEYIVMKRLGKERNVWQHKKNKMLAAFLDSMEVEIEASKKLQDWNQRTPDSKSPLAKADPTHLGIYKSTVMATAKQVFLNLLPILGKEIHEFPSLVDKLITFVEKEAESQSPEQILSRFLQKHESMSASSLEKKIFSILPPAAQSEVANEFKGVKHKFFNFIGKSEGERPSCVLSFIHFALSYVQYTMGEMNGIAKLLEALQKQGENLFTDAVIRDLFTGVLELLDKIYSKEFGQLKQEIRDKRTKDNVMPLEVLYRMLDSTYLSASFTEKQKYYEELQKMISSSAATFAKWLRSIYPSSHGKYVNEGRFEFPIFLNYLKKQLSKSSAKKEKVTQLKLHLQIGKLDQHSIEPFSKKELADIEDQLWTCLNKYNVDTVHEMALLIGKADSIRLDYTKAMEKCDVMSCIEKVRELNKHWNKFIPFENDESVVTDSGRLKIHLQFLLTHMEFMAMQQGDCSTITALDTTLRSPYVTNIDKAIETLEQFRRQNFHCVDSNSSFWDVEKWAEATVQVSEESDLQSAYQNGLHYVKFDLFAEADKIDANLNDSGTHSRKNLELIKTKFGQEGKQKFLNVADSDPDHIDRLFNLVCFFMKPTMKTGKQLLRDLQKLSIKEHQKQLPVWRKVQSICDQAEKYFCDLAKHTTPPLYILANFTAFTQSNVLDDLNLLNVKDKEVDLHLSYPHNEEIRKDFSRDDTKMPIELEILKKTLRIQQYPFTDILSVLVQISDPSKSKYLLNFYEIISIILRKGTLTSHADQWNQLTEIFKDIRRKSDGMYRIRKVKTHLACVLMQLDFSHSLRPLLCRLLLNLSDKKIGKTLAFTRMPNLSPETTKQQLVELFQEIQTEKVLEQVFLVPSEIIWYESLCNVAGYSNSTELTSEIHQIIIKYNPISWCSRLEQLYFNQIFRLFSTPSSKVLDLKNSIAHAVALFKLNDRGKKILRAIQQTKTYDEFKLTYLLQDVPQRVLYLNTINKMMSALLSSDVQVLESPRDCKMFLTLLRDIDVSTLSHVVNDKFPQNWLKWILIECISLQIMSLRHTIKATDEQGEQLKQILCDGLLHNMDSENVQFLLSLYKKLKSETDTTPRLVMQIIKGVVKSAFSPEEMRDVRKNFDKNVLIYWPRIIRIYRLTILCTKQGYDMHTVEKLLGMDESFGESIVDKLMDALFFSNIELQPEEKLKCLQKYCSTEWILDDISIEFVRGCNFKQIDEHSHRQRQAELSLDDILKRMKCNPINEKLICQLKSRIELIQQCENYQINSQIREDKAAFGEVMKEFSVKWYTMMSATHYKQLDDKGICNTLAFISRAVEYHYGYPPRLTQLVSVLMLVDGLIKDKPTGKIGEIETGEGKSVIVAMFAAVCSLFKDRVHVITSNKLLAEYDAAEASGFFEILGLTVSNNCDKDSIPESTRTARYNNNVVYGDLGSFQADKLQTDFFCKKIMEHSPNVTIVDEVDSLLLDKGAHMLYLSHSIPELRYLRPVFLLIWRTVNAHFISDERKKKNPTKPYTDADVHCVRRAVEIKMKDGVDEIEFPKCLRTFIDRRVGVWIKQAFIARFMPVNEDFIVEESQHRILTMDNDTGVEQGNMHMSLGLHQFLQLKHKTKLSPESLKCVFMSNHCYFAQHAGTVFGITGTLGSDEEINILSELYGVEFFAMPRYKLNKRIEEEHLVVDSQDEWMASILNSVACHKDKQPILIIAENIASHRKIQTALLGERIVDEAELKDYSSSEKHTDVIKKIANEDGLKVGSVVLSTNLGGRGTDLKIHQNAKTLGMHVILTFLPPNLRVEKQAFGRTARAGENGSVQLIIYTKEKQLNNGVNRKCQEQRIASIFYLKEERKRKEAKRLKIIRDIDIKKINIQDDLFAAYCQFRQTEIQQSIVFLQHKKRIRDLQLEFLNNRWAVWLDSIRELLDHLHLRTELQHQSIWQQFNIFKKEMVDRMEKKTDVRMFADFTSEFVKLGTTYEKIAIKWLFSSILSGDFSEADNILSEWKENIQSLWEGAKETFSAGKSLLTKMDPTAVTKLIDQLNEKLNAEKPPTDLEVGLKILKSASESEQKFSHPASLYKGMLVLQTNPTGKSDAKKALLEAKERIHSRIEFNYSALTMLDDACEEMGRNNENVNAAGPNKFKEQIINENNLLHIHLDAIQSTFHSPITVKFLKTQLPGVDSDDGAKKLLDFLLQRKWDLMMDYRVSKRVNVDQVSGIMTMGEKKFPGLAVPCLASSLAESISAAQSKTNRLIRATDFEDVVITRDQFLKELQYNNMVLNEAKSVYIIKKNQAPDDANVQTFPDSLKKYKEIVIGRLKQSINEIYEPEKILKNLSPTEAEVQELLRILIQLDWVEKTDLFIKPTAELSNLIASEDEPEYLEDELEYLEDNTKAFSSSDIYQLYKKLLKLKGIPQPIPIDCDEYIDIAALPFPTQKCSGSQDIFNALRSHGVIKDPRVKFPSTSAEPEKVSERLVQIREIFAKSDFKEELKRLFSRELQEKDEEFDQFQKRLIDLLQDSVGSLKKHPKIRVNYECVSTKVPLDTHAECEELQDFLSDGVFDRIIVLDEYVTFWENKGAWGILLAGACEIALGVTIEILSLGVLSPLAQFLISEGASDATYAFKHFYRGNRIDFEDHKKMKMESMKWSLSTCFIPGGALGGSLAVVGGKALLKCVIKRLAMEMGKAGMKALMFSFIEDNLEKGIQSNLLGIRLLIDNIFNSVEVQTESSRFTERCDSLFAACWENNQAKDLLTKIVSDVVCDDDANETSYVLEVNRTFDDLKTTFYRGMANNLSKKVLGSQNMLGSNRELGVRCQTDITLLVVNTMIAINSKITKKVAKVTEMKQKLVYAQAQAADQDKKEFEQWKYHILSKLKDGLRSRIVAKTYKTLTLQTMKKSLHASIRSGYKRVINAHEISVANLGGELDEEEEAEIPQMEGNDVITDNDARKKQFTFVKNARGRSIHEVEVEWTQLNESLGDIEFLTDTYGNTFVALRSEKSMKHHFVLSNEDAAYDNYLNWMNECNAMN